MALKNFMEDIVVSIVDEVLKKRFENNEDKKGNSVIYKEDIITYVLNRISPRYYTSERGILHGKLESQIFFQQKTDILLLVHEAIKVIKERRESELVRGKKNKIAKDIFLPHVFGEVLEETGFKIIPGIEVKLLFNDKPARMIDASWRNPYVTNPSTKGFFHFWPMVPEQKDTKKKRKYKFSLECKHSMFEKNRISFDLNVVDECNFYKSHILPIVLLKSLEGVDVSTIEI
jgi:competence protein ComFB